MLAGACLHLARGDGTGRLPPGSGGTEGEPGALVRAAAEFCAHLAASVLSGGYDMPPEFEATFRPRDGAAAVRIVGPGRA